MVFSKEFLNIFLLPNCSFLRELCHTRIESYPTFKILGDFNEETGAKSEIHWSNSLMNEWQQSCFAISSSHFPKIKLILLGEESVHRFQNNEIEFLGKIQCVKKNFSSQTGLSWTYRFYFWNWFPHPKQISFRNCHYQLVTGAVA